MTCKLCLVPKTWDGDERQCAFDGGETFANWNCGTMNALRDIAQSDRPEVSRKFAEDQWHATIDLMSLHHSGGITEAYALWMTWYKRRGRTEQVLLLHESGARWPIEAECEEIIAYFAPTSGTA